MKTNIIINFTIEGLHNWPDAKEIKPEVSFLSDMHRHIFYFCCKKEVNHNDRDIEIILFKRGLIYYLYRRYASLSSVSPGYCNFGSNSCEMLANELAEKFDLNYCSVLEDNENGAETYK